MLKEELLELVLNDYLRGDKPQAKEEGIEEEYILMLSSNPNKVLTTDYVKETVRCLAQREGDPREIVVTIKINSEKSLGKRNPVKKTAEKPADFDSEGPQSTPLNNLSPEELLKELKEKEQEKDEESKTRPVAYVAPMKPCPKK
ncbi:GL22851 [Drosophila persimilis]|uniref:GL22851 n=1 Tax=Drosophila persimilis TaxID=7234 RepID=B4GZR5_DROPE|nr:GL22851 [Drosophila persimilis]